MKDMRKKFLLEEKRCLYCGAGPDRIRRLNPKPEFRGGVANFSFRCDECNRYFREYWINGKLIMTGAC
jgi:hypothetical protein